MKKNVYKLIFVLIAISMLGVLTMQGYWLKNQYVQNKIALETAAKEVLGEVDQYLRKEVNSRANIDTDDLESLDFYYESADSTINFLIQKLQRKTNNDGSLYVWDEALYDSRLKQFREVVSLLESENPSADPDLGEGFVLLYGQKRMDISDEKEWSKLFVQLDLDSLLQAYLAERNIFTSYHVGIFDNKSNVWDYLSAGADTSLLVETKVKWTLMTDHEDIFLQLERPAALLFKRMLKNLVLSVLLVLLLLGSLFFMLSVIVKQKQVSEIKTDFINNMTHEFKTPLATIAFATANIENPMYINDAEQIKTFTKVIKEENKRMNQQVEKVLGAAVAEKRAFKLKYEEIDLHSILLSLRERFIMKFASSNQSLTLKLDAKRPLVRGDKLHITNLLSNIIDNAIKYSPEGGEISISTKVNNSRLEILVSDEGIGISKEQQKRIFEKFYRVPTGNIHNIKGFGLGLNYAKTVAEQHGGFITVSSKLDKGSNFKVVLPLKNK